MKTSRLQFTNTSKRIGLSFSHILIVSALIIANSSCSEDALEPNLPTAVRYIDQVFEGSKPPITVNYGTTSNEHQVLEFYEPSDDDEINRPLILLSPGGGYRTHSQINQIQDLCRHFALKGYATALVKYSVTSDDPTADIWVRSSVDHKTAVQYFKLNSNKYGIDPNNIFVGGWSTGSNVSFNTAFVDENELNEYPESDIKGEIMSAIYKYGFDGEYDNVDTTVKGALIMFSVTLDINFIDGNEPALMLINHKDAEYRDGTKVIGEFVYDGIDQFGTDAMYLRAQNAGYVLGQNLEYIRMEHATNSANVDVLTRLNVDDYEAITQFFYRNL